MTLKILFLINGLEPDGTERSLAEMLPGFIAAGIEPVVVCFKHHHEGVEDIVKQMPLQLHFITGKKLPGRLRAVRQLVAREKPALVHAALFEANLASRLATIGTGVTVLNSLVNTSYDRIRLRDPNLSPFKLWAVQSIDSWTGRYRVDHYHAVSHTVKMAAIEKLAIPAERITVVERGRNPVRLGTPSPERRRETRARLGLGADTEILLNVGRQEFQKGQKYLLQAMEQVAVQRPNTVLLIAGRFGNASKELQAIHAGLSCKDRIRFLGHRDDVPDLLAAADLFVFPSLFEGMSGALIEAMALGLPIVTSDIPVLHEAAEKNRNALFVEPANPTALSNAILDLLRDRPRAEAFSRRSREIFEDRFTLNRIVERMVTMYRQLAAP